MLRGGAEGYFFGDRGAEQQRLVAQAQSLESLASRLLDEIGIEPGWQAIDVGCGPLGVLPLLSERVGPSGTVVGLEREPRFAMIAQREIARRRLTNVSVLQADALQSGLPSRSFDLAHERLVMINMPEPKKLLFELIQLVRPGGTVALEESDNALWLCEPSHPSWEKLVETFYVAARAHGYDLFIGRRLPNLLRASGIENVNYKVHVDAAPVGGYRRTHLLAVVNSLRDQIVRLGLLNGKELDAHRAALADHLADPETTVIDKLFVQAWGRKPR